MDEQLVPGHAAAPRQARLLEALRQELGDLAGAAAVDVVGVVDADEEVHLSHFPSGRNGRKRAGRVWSNPVRPRMCAATNGQGTKNAAATTRPAATSASTGTAGPGRSGSGRLRALHGAQRHAAHALLALHLVALRRSRAARCPLDCTGTSTEVAAVAGPGPGARARRARAGAAGRRCRTPSSPEPVPVPLVPVPPCAVDGYV